MGAKQLHVGSVCLLCGGEEEEGLGITMLRQSLERAPLNLLE